MTQSHPALFVHKFSIQKRNLETNEYEYQTKGSLNLGTHKPVVKLKVILSSLHRIITLSDHLLQIINSDTLQLIPNIKLTNIRTFAISSKTFQGASIDMCISTKRNKLQVYQLDRRNIHLIYDISGHTPLISIGMDECGILACSETSYFSSILPTNTNDRSASLLRKILTVKDSNIPTCFTRISSGKYLLNGPNIGILSTLDGLNPQTSMTFKVQPHQLAYSHPYLLVLIENFIHIYSYLDNQLKQEIPFENCQTLLDISQENLHEILAHNHDTVYLLQCLPLQEQIDQLLDVNQFQEALNLASSSDERNSLLFSTKKRVARREFRSMNVIPALQLFDEVHLNFHEIIEDIPSFSPLNSPWPDLDKNQYIQWLTAFSDYMTKHFLEFSHQNDYYSSLLKAYLILKSPPSIIEYLQLNAQFIPMEFTQLLFHCQLYHGAALLYSAHEQHEQAIDIWQKIVLNAYSHDSTFPGIAIIGKYILENDFDRQFQFQTAKWLFEQEENQLAIEIFLKKYQTESIDDPFRSENIIALIQSSPIWLKTYLEGMILQFNIPNESMHALLMDIYLDEIFSNSPSSRENFREFLIKSNFYSIPTVRNRLAQTNDFEYELALLHGKVNDYDQAFRILVDNLEDFHYAENYCRILSNEKSLIERQTISHQLYRIYLQSLDKNPSKLTEAILHLLSNPQLDFNFPEILQSLPPSWSISSIRPMLERAFRLALNRHRSVRLELALNRLQNDKFHIRLAKLKRSNVLINKYRRCKYCLHQFYETSCVIDRDGSQMHVHCAKIDQENPTE